MGKVLIQSLFNKRREASITEKKNQKNFLIKDGFMERSGVGHHGILSLVKLAVGIP